MNRKDLVQLTSGAWRLAVTDVVIKVLFQTHHHHRISHRQCTVGLNHQIDSYVNFKVVLWLKGPTFSVHLSMVVLQFNGVKFTIRTKLTQEPVPNPLIREACDKRTVSENFPMSNSQVLCKNLTSKLMMPYLAQRKIHRWLNTVINLKITLSKNLINVTPTRPASTLSYAISLIFKRLKMRLLLLLSGTKVIYIARKIARFKWLAVERGQSTNPSRLGSV